MASHKYSSRVGHRSSKNETAEIPDNLSQQQASEFPRSSMGLFITTLALNAVIGLVLLALFEIKRNKRSVYAPRLDKLPHRAPPQLPYGPLRWIYKVATLSGPETLRLAGMDAYCLVRFIYLCLRICLFASFWGMLVLTPIYTLGDGEASGIYYLTLANVAQSSNKFWATLVFAYLFTCHALYILRGEHQVFAAMREEYLTRGDPDFSAQTLYTSKVENVPAELRSAVALEAYFEDLFPGQVHSAVMCLSMRALEDKVQKREMLADKLEKTRSLELKTGKKKMHSNRRFWCDCWGRSSGQTKEEFLIEKLEKFNDEIKSEQKAFLLAARQLNSMDDQLMRKNASPSGIEGGGGYGTSSARGSMEKLDAFMEAKKDKESRWAIEEEDIDESAASSYGAAPTSGSPGRNARHTSSPIERVDIEEELEARRRMAKPEASESSSRRVAQVEDPPLENKPLGASLVDNVFAQDALSSITFIGNTALETTRKVARGVLYLTLGQRMSNTGFVTFQQMSACAASRQVLLAPRPSWCDSEPAPDPRDVVWKNIAVPQHMSNIRRLVAGFLVGFGALFWSIPVTLIQVWASFSELEKIFPWLSVIDEDSVLYSLISGYLPVVLLLLLMVVLPFLFQLLASRYERIKSHSEIQRSVLTRYFLYQVANIYITVASGSIFSALSEIVTNPASVLTILGDTFPAVAVYFLDVIVVKTLAGLPFEILRGWPLIQVLWSQKCTNRAYATEREKRNGPFGAAEMLYGWVYPTLLLVLVVCFIYAIISPFIMPAGCIYFAFAYIVYKHQVLYVYVPKYQSGGVFWFSVYPRILIGLGLAQLTLAGYVYLRQGYTQATLMLPLPVLVYCYGYLWSFCRYVGPAERISMETAARIDRRGAATTAAAVKLAAEGRRGRRWRVSADEDEAGSESGILGHPADKEDINPDDFEPLLYAQLALTSPPIEPEDCSLRGTVTLASEHKDAQLGQETSAEEKNDDRGGDANEPQSPSAPAEETEAQADPAVTEGGAETLTLSPAFRGRASGDGDPGGRGDRGSRRREQDDMRRRAMAASVLSTSSYLVIPPPALPPASDPEARHNRTSSDSVDDPAATRDSAAMTTPGALSSSALEALEAPLLGPRAAAARVASHSRVTSSPSGYADV